MNPYFDRERLLHLAREDRPDPSRITAIQQRLHASVATGAPTPSLGAVGWGVKAGLALLAAVPLAVAAAGLGGGGEAPPAGNDVVAASPVEQETRLPPAGVPLIPPASPEPTAATPAPSPPQAPPRGRKDVTAQRVAEPTAEGLEVEAALLRAAAAALHEGNLSAARQALRDHERRFAAGALALERRLLGVKVACLQGDTDAAIQAARAMVAQGVPARTVRQLETSCAAPALKESPAPP